MLSVVKMLLKGEVGGRALNSNGNNIVDHRKSWKKHKIVILKFCGNPDLRTLKTQHHIFALFLQTVYVIEKLLAGFNMQPRIGMNQSLIWLHYHATLLMTSHGYIQHPASFCTIKEIKSATMNIFRKKFISF